MKLVVLSKTFPGDLELSEAKLDEGEHIVKRVVPLSKLYEELQGTLEVCRENDESDRSIRIRSKGEPKRLVNLTIHLTLLQGFVVDAKLFHLAAGLDLAKSIA